MLSVGRSTAKHACPQQRVQSDTRQTRNTLEIQAIHPVFHITPPIGPYRETTMAG